MALNPIIVALGGTVTVSLDVTTAGVVDSISAVNGSQRNVTVSVIRPSGQVVSRSVAAGASASITIVKGKQFVYDDSTGPAADWALSLSVG